MNFNDWLKTETGSQCNNYSTLTGPEYLRNRLYWAFIAQDDEISRLQKTIEWYEQRLKTLTEKLKESEKENNNP